VRLVAAVERERIASREIFLDNCRQGCKVINPCQSDVKDVYEYSNKGKV